MYPDIHRYYQLLDRDTSTITSLWKVLHITCLVVASVSGFITAYSFGKSMEAFGDNCILNAKLEFIGANVTELSHFAATTFPSDLEPLDIAASEWGSMRECYFCQFTPLVSMICAIILATFFIMCSKGGAGYITDSIYRPWRLVYPAMFFAAIATVVMLVSSIQLDLGTSEFCKEFERVFHTTKCTTNIDRYTLTFSSSQRRLVLLLRIAIYCSYTCFTSWLLLLVVLILRVVCIADFQMIRITVTSRENTLGIINPDDMDTSSIFSSDTSSVGSDSKRRFFFLPRRRRTSVTSRKSQSSLHKTPSRDSRQMDEERLKKRHTLAFDVSDYFGDATRRKIVKATNQDEEDDADFQQETDKKRKRKSLPSPRKSAPGRSSGFFRRPRLFSRKIKEPPDNATIGSTSIDSFALEAERKRGKIDTNQQKSISARKSSRLLRLYEEEEIYKTESTFSLVEEDSNQKQKTGTKPSTSTPRIKELQRDNWVRTSLPFTPQEGKPTRKPESTRPRGSVSHQSNSLAQHSVRFLADGESKTGSDEDKSAQFDEESDESSESCYSILIPEGKRKKRKRSKTQPSVSAKSNVSSKGSVSSRSSRKNVASKKSDYDRPATSAQSTVPDEEGKEVRITTLPLSKLEEKDYKEKIEMAIPDSSQSGALTKPSIDAAKPSVAATRSTAPIPRPADDAGPGTPGRLGLGPDESHQAIDVSVQTASSKLIQTLSEQLEKEKKKRKEEE